MQNTQHIVYNLSMEQRSLVEYDDEKRVNETARELGLAKTFLIKESLKNAMLLARLLESKNEISPASHRIIQSTFLDAMKTIKLAEEQNVATITIKHGLSELSDSELDRIINGG